MSNYSITPKTIFNELLGGINSASRKDKHDEEDEEEEMNINNFVTKVDKK